MRTAAAAGIVAILAGLVARAPRAGLGWELAAALGLAGLAACLLLFCLPVRARGASPSGSLPLSRHRWLGWIALLLGCAHAAALVGVDPLVLEYLKPTLPWYQLAGVLATAIMLVLCLSAEAAMRRRLLVARSSFQVVHLTVSCAALVCLAAHVQVSGRYAWGPLPGALCLGTVLVALALMVRSRWRAESSPSQHGAPAPALRRRSAWLVSLVALLAAVLILVPGFAPVARSLREPLLPRARTLPLDFPHARHVAVNCIACHHNYTDGRGLDTCVSCHRSGRADLQRGAEARFHDFCLGCHRARHDRDRHGPVAACAACHGARRPAT